MSWKISITAFISLLFVSFPQNIIGCGDSEDPFDYYTSFFSKRLADKEKVYEPFYYTALLDFYDDWQWDKPVNYEADPVLREWRALCSNARTTDAVALIYNSEKETVDSLLQTTTSAAKKMLPLSLQNNSLAQCLLTKLNIQKLQYLHFAKRTEAVSAVTDWEAREKTDSLKINTYIAEAEKAFKQTNDPFLKTKYAFQRCKLAFYNNRFQDCINWYDSYFTADTKGAVHQLALSYKGGSLFRLGRNTEAAYTFSLAFPLADHNKKQTYLGFLWATNECDTSLQNGVLALAKNNDEKANILGMFSLFGQSSRIKNLQQIASIQPSSPFLPVLAIREINKLEEQYLSPLLAAEKGGKSFYFLWKEDSLTAPSPQPLNEALAVFTELSQMGAVKNKNLFTVGSAYLLYMKKDYKGAKQFLQAAQTADVSTQDQASLLNILITISEKKTMDREGEAALLPSVQWLVNKAKNEGPEEYSIFLRNLFSEILAQKYEQQGDVHKAALAYGVADLQFLKEEKDYATGVGVDYIRNEMGTDGLLKLYTLQTSTDPTPFEKALISLTSLRKDDVVDVLGTAYLRVFEFEKAAQWLKKVENAEPIVATKYNYTTDKETVINVNPFHDYLNDWQRLEKPLTKPYTKLLLAQKMMELQRKADTAKNAEVKARAFYELASAFYNMSHYGNSWSAVAYYRSGSDWNEGVYDQPWHREYFGVYKAGEYYQKAFTLTKDREFKAAAYFMTAKCAQRQLVVPPYNYDNYEAYEKSQSAFEKKFRNNSQFALFKKDFGDTKFYQYAFTRCSYLRDFVKTQAKVQKR